MVAVDSGTILVTGASGYVGSWVVKYLVDAGYKVIVVARAQPQIDYIVNRFPEYSGKVTGKVIPVLEAPGAYDDVVKEVDAVVHIALVMNWTNPDPKAIVQAAVDGNTTLLKSAAEVPGSRVKRIVFTSSAVAASFGYVEGASLDENAWNENILVDGKPTSQDDQIPVPLKIYATVKVETEKAAFDFVAKHQPKFDIASVLPSLSLGPYIHDVKGKKDPGSSIHFVLSTLPAGDLSGKPSFDYVDIRDVADVHVKALGSPAAGGQRILATSHGMAYTDVYTIWQKLGAPGLPPPSSYTASAPRTDAYLSNAKSLRLFPGLKYRGLEESATELGKDLIRDGFLEKLADGSS